MLSIEPLISKGAVIENEWFACQYETSIGMAMGSLWVMKQCCTDHLCRQLSCRGMLAPFLCPRHPDRRYLRLWAGTPPMQITFSLQSGGPMQPSKPLHQPISTTRSSLSRISFEDRNHCRRRRWGCWWVWLSWLAYIEVQVSELEGYSTLELKPRTYTAGSLQHLVIRPWNPSLQRAVLWSRLRSEQLPTAIVIVITLLLVALQTHQRLGLFICQWDSDRIN